MLRRAFTALELLLVIGIIGGLSVIIIPSYRDYQVRSDLHNATEQVSQALGRAKLLSEAGQQESPWGFSVSQRTLFAGTGYTNRIPDWDELYPFPQTIEPSGLDEVSFSRLTGYPSATGTIVLTSLRGEKQQVNILIDRRGIAVNTGDKLTICHCEANPPHTLYLPESAWPGHRDHGDYLGACKVPETKCGD